MRKATQNDREKVVTTLLEAFKKNKSVNYIVGKKENKIRYLMEYSFDTCMDSGEVFISDDGNACALIQFQDQKRFSLRNTYLDIQLILKTIGIGNVFRALSRESFIKKHYPKEPFTYLWFVGVNPDKQRNGFGTGILKEITEYSSTLDRPVYLETSTESNLPWYQKHGFEIYDVSERFGFPFYFLKNA